MIQCGRVSHSTWRRRPATAKTPWASRHGPFGCTLWMDVSRALCLYETTGAFGSLGQSCNGIRVSDSQCSSEGDVLRDDVARGDFCGERCSAPPPSQPWRNSLAATRQMCDEGIGLSDVSRSGFENSSIMSSMSRSFFILARDMPFAHLLLQDCKPGHHPSSLGSLVFRVCRFSIPSKASLCHLQGPWIDEGISTAKAPWKRRPTHDEAG